MYICICNAICDKSINQAIDDGSGKVSEVYAACGAKPQCGACKNDIKEMIEDRKVSHMNSGD